MRITHQDTCQNCGRSIAFISGRWVHSNYERNCPDRFVKAKPKARPLSPKPVATTGRVKVVTPTTMPGAMKVGSKWHCSICDRRVMIIDIGWAHVDDYSSICLKSTDGRPSNGTHGL